MFLLTKWYGDCVAEDGTAWIGYSARVSLGPLSIPYAAALHKRPGCPARERTAVRACEGPEIRDGQLRWDCPPLGVTATWLPDGAGYDRMLLESADGSIRWTCHVPRGASTIDLMEEGRLSGLGYAEQLTMTVRPDRLPFDELRWGRFLAPDDAVTWIAWRGSLSRQWVFHNGVEIAGAVLHAARIEWPAGRTVLALSDPATIREGRLISTALGRIPAGRLLLGGVAGAYEAKWLARGTLATERRSSAGWAIHEVVRLRDSRCV